MSTITDKLKSAKKKKILLLSIIATSMLAASHVYSAPENATESSTVKLNSVQKRHEQKIKTVTKNVNKLLEEIKILENSKQFKNAEEDFKNIYTLYKTLGNSKYVNIKLNNINVNETQFYKKWSDYLEEQSTAAYLNNEWEKSIKLSKESMKILKKVKDNTGNQTLKEKNIIQNAQNKLIEDKFKKELLIKNIDPAYKYKKEDKDIHLMQAEFYIKNRMFSKARNSLEQVLLIDPYDYKAMKLLKNVYRELAKVGYARSDAELIEKLANAQWTNNQTISPDVVHGEVLTVKETSKVSVSKITKKLKNLIINKIDFDNASVSSVITYLNRESKILDKEDNLGINIVLRLDRTSESNTERITMALDEVPIGEAIKYVCLSAGLKYIIEEHAIIIGNEAIDEMITKFFQIESGLINSILSSITLSTDEFSGVGTNFYDTSEFGQSVGTETNEITTQQLKNYFVERGVPFPENSTIAWDNKTSTLIVTNSSTNIRILEDLIKDIDIQIPLILIETKFVEIKQTELEEIAFKWKFDLTGDKIGMNDFTKGFNAEQGSTATQLGNDTLLRYLNANGTPTTKTAQTPDVGALVNNLTKGWSNGFGGLTNLNFWMYALDRSKTAEILSSPKIITKSGSPALIRMVQEEYFPTSWTKPSLSLVDNSVSGNFSRPEFDEPTDLGIRLEVTATVSPNNHTIYLDLHPEVIEQVGWENYDYDIRQEIYDQLGNKIQEVFYPTPLKMARISHRDVTTNVKIYDGESIVLGGMITEKSTFVEDKYPIIGDIPLIGRLFKSKFETIEKTNLLIFVTARLINPDGTPIRKNEKGLFDYNR
jgi:type II secretory pathway component GspD/PulD (secretin)